MHLLNNKDTHIIVNDSHTPHTTSAGQEERIHLPRHKKGWSRKEEPNITGQAIKRILHVVDNNILQNLPILREDFGMAEDIYGPSIPHLKVKTVRRKIQHVEPVKIASVPQTILDNYKEVTILCDPMYINGSGLLNTISWHIMFATGSMIKNRKVEHILDGITQVHKLHPQHWFNITHMHANSNFEQLRREMTDLVIKLKCASKEEHVPVIERFIRTVKERVRSAQTTMPFNRVSKLRIVHLVASDIFWINTFPPSTPGAGLSYIKFTR